MVAQLQLALLSSANIAQPETGAFAEFFAGIGLVRLALEDLAWTCRWANDIDPKKAAIYRQNFPGDDLIVADIAGLAAAQIPRVDLWTASFPCVDLSLAGQRRGLVGEGSGLFWRFIDLLRAARAGGTGPDRIMLENVVGLLTSRGGADIRAALLALTNLGYRYDVIVLDARRFVPQSRPRVFILAEHAQARLPRLVDVVGPRVDTRLCPPVLRRLMLQNPGLTWAHLPLPALPTGAGHLRDVIEPLPATDTAWLDAGAVERIVGSLSPINAARLARMRRSAEVEHATLYRRTRHGAPVWELRDDGLAGCLRVARGGSSRQYLLVAENGQTRVRPLTVREAGRLQGVPDSFRCDVPTTQGWNGFGDAVCVPAVRWLARSFCRPQPRPQPMPPASAPATC